MAQLSFKETLMRYGVEGVIYDGKRCIFSGTRIKKDTLPEGLSMYYIRHKDDDWCSASTIEIDNVIVNFMGILITDEPLDISNFYHDTYTNRTFICRDIEDGDFSFTGDFFKSLKTMTDFMNMGDN